MSEGLKDTSIVWLFSNVDETTGGGAQRGWYPTRQESILRIDRHIDRHIDRYMDRYIDTYIDRYIDRRNFAKLYHLSRQVLPRSHQLKA